MNTIEGDLIKLALEGRFDVIIHGCNCFCAMEAGIACRIKEIFPAAYLADQATVKGDRSKLGTFTKADVLLDTSHHLTVINAYTQYHWKGTGVLADYGALKKAFMNIKKHYSGKRIGYPAIGAGLARGNWQKIAELIEDALMEEDHALVKYFPG